MTDDPSEVSGANIVDGAVDGVDGRAVAAEAPETTAAEAAAPLGGSARSVGVAIAVAAVVVAADQITKIWARSRLADGEVIDLGLLDLNLVFNTGASFGFGSQVGPFIGTVAALVAVGLLAYSRTMPSRLSAAVLGAIAGGAIGNVLDRIFRSNPAGDTGYMRGAVIDFIDLRWWPVFNVADMAVVCGAIFMVLISLRES